MREHELEADQERTGERSELKRRLPGREERRSDRADDKNPFQHPLDDVEVRDAARVVLRPIPERERRLPRDLGPQRAFVEDASCFDRVGVEQQYREGRDRRQDESGDERGRGTEPSHRPRIGQPERRDDECRKLRPS